MQLLGDSTAPLASGEGCAADRRPPFDKSFDFVEVIIMEAFEMLTASQTRPRCLFVVCSNNPLVTGRTRYLLREITLEIKAAKGDR